LPIETPAGLVIAYAHANESKTRIKNVAFDNVPSFVYKRDLTISLDGQEIVYDISYGGAFYAYVDISQIKDLGLQKENCRQLIEIGTRIKRAVMNTVEIKHPVESDLGFLYGKRSDYTGDYTCHCSQCRDYIGDSIAILLQNTQTDISYRSDLCGTVHCR
jgi:proline racemase